MAGTIPKVRPDPEITEPINAVSLFDEPKTAEEKAEHFTDEVLEATSKDWIKADSILLDVDAKSGEFDAPEFALTKINGKYDLTTDLNKTPVFDDEAKNIGVVKSLYFQHRLADLASNPLGVIHFKINGKPIVAYRNFVKRGEGKGQITNKHTINAYLTDNRIGVLVANPEPGSVYEGPTSKFILIAVNQKPPAYDKWKAQMKAKYGKAADILP